MSHPDSHYEQNILSSEESKIASDESQKRLDHNSDSKDQTTQRPQRDPRLDLLFAPKFTPCPWLQTPPEPDVGKTLRI